MTNNSVLQVENLSVFAGKYPILSEIYLDFEANCVTGIMGRSGCGKTTLMRSLNRLNDLLDGMTTEGKVIFNGKNIYSEDYDLVQLRRQIGMLFQKPAPFPTTIYKNITMPLKANGYRQNLDDIVEESLRKVALWNEVKNRLHKSALTLSGGQQQRLCLARAIAIKPQVLLLDEPTSALDPISTLEIENLIYDLKENYTIILTTHDLKQIARVCDQVVYMSSRENEKGQKTGFIVEKNTVEDIFLNPQSQETLAYTSYFSAAK